MIGAIKGTLGVLAVIAALLVPAAAASATTLPTTISVSTTLTAAASPYTGTSVTVPTGVTLAVEPGVEVRLGGTLTVNGNLTASGTSSVPVLFTSATNSAAGQWSGIRFNAGSTGSVITGAEIRYASTAITVSGGASPQIDSSFIHANSATAISISGASPEIRGNTISGNGSGAISFSAPSDSPGAVNINDNLIEGNKGTAVRVSAPTASNQIESASMGSNTIIGNTGKAIEYDAYATTSTQYHSNPIPPNITTNTVAGNTQNGIWLRGKVAQSTTWNNSGYPIVIESESALVDNGATLTLGAGMVIKGPLKVGGINGGLLNAEGTAESPVIFTSPKDDSAGGDSNGDGAATMPAPGDWADLVFEAKGGGSLDHVIVRYGGRSSYGGDYASLTARCPCSNPLTIERSTIRKSQYSGLNLFQSNARVIDSTITENGGGAFDMNSGAPEIERNVVTNNGGGGISLNVSQTYPGSVDINDNLIEGNKGIGIRVNAPTAYNKIESASLGGNTITGNTGKAIEYDAYAITTTQYHSNPIPPNITTNTINGNSQNGIWLRGKVAESTTWEDHGYPLVAEPEAPIVDNEATLTMSPGLVMKGGVRVGGINGGTLKAEGTAENPIVFTSPKDDSAGGDSNGDGAATMPAPGDWADLVFEAKGGGSLDHVIVRYGGRSSYGGDYAALTSRCPCTRPLTVSNSTVKQSSNSGFNLYKSNARVLNTVVKENAGAGFGITGGNPEINGNTVTNNSGTGIGYSASSGVWGEINILNNYVKGCSAGIVISITGSPPTVTTKALSGNTVIGCAGPGLSYKGPDIAGDITSNLLNGNAVDDIQLSGTVAHSSTWTNGGTAVRMDGPVTVPAGVTLTIKPGVYLRQPNMTVNGTLLAEGSAQNPIVFTGLKEETGGEWGGVALEPGSGGSVLDYVEMGYGGSGTSMLNIKKSSPQITHSTFRRSSGNGIRVQESGSPTIEGNRFRNNNFGLRYEGEGKLAAPNNDWGCVNGPKPTGCGDQVSSNVSWQPAVVLPELPRHCPGTMMSASAPQCLLAKFEPVLRYDSQEPYWADSAAEMTDNYGDEIVGLWGTSSTGAYGNKLVDGDTETSIGESNPTIPASFRLSLLNLSSPYPNSQLPDENDWLDARNDHYEEDAHALEARGYANQAYAHATPAAGGGTWLQYWYFYYYNSLAVLGVGKHEGDWESVEVLVDSQNKPQIVLLSQHEGAARCSAIEMQQSEEGGPVVYVANGSHANYPYPGTYDLPDWVDWGPIEIEDPVNDSANGEGAEVSPPLQVIGNGLLPSWVVWPGHWGNSRGGGANSTSPTGPADHEAWNLPQSVSEDAINCASNYDGGELFAARSATTAATAEGDSSPAPPSITSATMHGKRPEISYRLPNGRGAAWPRLMVSVEQLGDGAAPSTRVLKGLEEQGRVSLPLKVKSPRSAVVLASVFYRDGSRSRVIKRPLSVLAETK